MLAEKEYSAIELAYMAWRRRRFITVPIVLGVFGTLTCSSTRLTFGGKDTNARYTPHRFRRSWAVTSSGPKKGPVGSWASRARRPAPGRPGNGAACGP